MDIKKIELYKMPDALNEFVLIEPKLEESIDKGTTGTKPKNQDADKEDYELRIAEQAARKETLQNDDLSQSIKFRGKLTNRIFDFILVWMFYIGIVVFWQGTQGTCLLKYGFKLSDNVLIALLGTTTVTVVGLFATVTKHFFFDKNNNKKEKD